MADHELNAVKHRLELLATVLLIVVTVSVGGLVAWERLFPQETARAAAVGPLPSESVSVADAPIRGSANARVALIVFSEFECPFCGTSARDVLPEIEREYFDTGKAFLAFRHSPLAIHKNAQKAAEAAECAGRQGQFWEFHDWAFANQKGLANVEAAADVLRLDTGQFVSCLGGQAVDRVKGDVEAARAFAVRGTPTWFLGIRQEDGRVMVTERIQGAVPLEELRAAIDRTIAAAHDLN